MNKHWLSFKVFGFAVGYLPWSCKVFGVRLDGDIVEVLEPRGRLSAFSLEDICLSDLYHEGEVECVHVEI